MRKVMARDCDNVASGKCCKMLVEGKKRNGNDYLKCSFYENHGNDLECAHIQNAPKSIHRGKVTIFFPFSFIVRVSFTYHSDSGNRTTDR